MSGPQTKRKVMGRVELGHSERSTASASTPSPRIGAKRASAPSGVATSSRAVSGSGRARVNISSVAGPSGRSSPDALRAHTSFHASPITSPPLTQSGRNSSAGTPSLGTSVPVGYHAVPAPHVRSPLTETAATFSSVTPAGSAHQQHTSVHHVGPPAKVRAIVNTQARQSEPQRDVAAARIRTPSNGSPAEYFNVDPIETRPMVRKQPSFGTANIRARNRVSLALSDSSQQIAQSPLVQNGSASPSVPAGQPIATSQHKISHTSRPSLGGSSAMSSSSASGLSPMLPSDATMPNVLRRPSLIPNGGSSTHIHPLAGPQSPPRRDLDLIEHDRQVFGNADDTAFSSPDQMRLWDAAQGAGTPRDATFLTASTSSGSGLPLLSPTKDLGEGAKEAKVNRKILDLEISNKSLLAINSSLEVVKLKQAREIRELKRRLREGQGIESIVTGGEHRVHDAADAESDADDEDEQFLSSALDHDGPLQAELEASHARCKSMIDDMVQRARSAILSRPEAPRQSIGNRVLHPAELEGMMDSIESTPLEMSKANSSMGAPGSDVASDSEPGFAPSMSASVEGTSPVTPPWAVEHEGSLDDRLVAGTARLALDLDTPKRA